MNLFDRKAQAKMEDIIKSRAGQVAGTNLIVWAAVIIVLIVFLVLGATLIEDMDDDLTAGGTGANISQDGLDAIQEFSSKANLIVLAIVFGVILTILIGIVIIVRRNIA